MTVEVIDGAAYRILRRVESRISTLTKVPPLVVESIADKSTKWLCDHVRSNSRRLLEEVARRGAILFRNFDVSTVHEFESVLTSIGGVRGIRHFLIPEPGRDRVDGAQFALHTNTKYRTGGALSLTGFHSENFYAADVPRYIAFHCLHASWLGGETGIVDMASVYAGLPATLKHGLGARAFLASVVPIDAICAQFACRESLVRTFCERVGLEIAAIEGRYYAKIYKPCVFEIPETGERSLVTNISAELGPFGLKAHLMRNFLPDYSSSVWLAHRIAWFLSSRRRKRISKAHGDPLPRIGFCFSPSNIKDIAKLLRSSYSSFIWRRHDVLILDNLRMAHSGMPGIGPRMLHAAICNPIAVRCDEDGPGIWTQRENPEEGYTKGERLRQLVLEQA